MEWVSGNIFIRPNFMKKGDIIHGHTHNFDHTSFVVTGAVHVKAKLVDGRIIERDFGEGTGNGRHFLVKAEVEHEITALMEPTEFYCIYSHRNPQGEVIQNNIGWTEGYM